MDGTVAGPATTEPTFGRNTVIIRAVGWISVTLIFAFVISTYLTVWLGWPGVTGLLAALSGAESGGESGLTLGLLQGLIYLAAIVGPILLVVRTPHRDLRTDAMAMSALTNFVVRAAFWAVLLIGAVDAVISFLRVEGFLASFVGNAVVTELGRSRFRGPYVHAPLILVGIVIALRTRTLGFQWLGLLVVLAELFIVLGRFIYSYEQAFQGDLVRFWYGALFLFASAYTLFDDGHVRVDVLYSGFTQQRKGAVNAVGALLLGLPLCWTILVFGMMDKSSIINSALLTYEVSQSGFGMYVKYWMAGFLAIFAISMGIQFSSTFLEGIADSRDEPGRRETSADTTT